MGETRLPWSAALSAWDRDALVAQLADDAVIRVAVHDAPMQGTQVAHFLFGVLGEVLAPPRITDEITEDGKAVVLFETALGETAAQGLNVIRYDDAGKISELTVFFRPLQALAEIAAVVGGRMAAEFGPPPE